jgi:hypothetical protein
VALGEEPCDVRLRGVRREAAERNLVGLAAIARRQRQVEVARGDPRILEEHLVEVAEAKQEDRVAVLGLDAEILREEVRLPVQTRFRFFAM